MLVSEVVVLATAFVTFISTVAASSCCAYICRKHENQNTIELLKKTKDKLADLIDGLIKKDKAGAVVTSELPKFIRDADAYLSQVGESIAIFKGDQKCLCELMPNLWAQKKARIQIERDLSLLNSWIRKAEIMDAKPVRGYRHLDEVVIVGEKRRETADRMLNLITSGYSEPGTSCIYGTFGVGKTVIAKYIYNKALNEDDPAFNSFIWVNVEHEASLWKIQEDLAKALEVDLPKRRGGDVVVVETAPNDTADTVERAGILAKALLQKGNFLLVLDSIWQPLSLHDIGIPQLVGGRKLIVTSRKSTVCDGIVGIEMVEIEPLTNAIEAWDLFHKEMDSVQGLTFDSITGIKRALLEELCGFPLAINKLARTLRNMQKQKTADLNRAWRNELTYLVHKPIYQEGRDLELFNRFRNSYNNLNEQIRCCFQYCVLFPKDYDIESKELIEYWMWEGFLGEFDTLEEGMEKGTQALRELKNAHVLQNGSDHEKVKLLSLVRSMTIATMLLERKPICIGSGSSLASLPPSGTYWNSMVERASFVENKLEALVLKEKLDCGQLCTLLLQDNPLVSDSNQAFFSSMLKLKVLDLSRTYISTLPKSLSNLVELRALLLRNCPNLSNLPSLSRLSELMVLDLSGTPLKHFPEGIASMKKLRRLDLSHTKLGSFPAAVVGKLTELEELLMITDLGCVWGLIEDEERQGGCIEDLLNLRKVSILQLHFQSAKAFHKYITKAEMGINVPSKFLLYVGDVEHGGYVQQNSLTISGRSHMGTSGYRASGLELILTSLQKLKNLNVLDVSNFSDLSYLISVDILEYITQLRELCVRSCEEMVEVVCQTPEKCKKIYLPHLTKIVFFDLPKLRSVCCGAVLDCPALESVEVWRCENLKLPMFSTVSNREIRIRGEESWVGSLEWDNPGNLPHFQSRPHKVPNFKLVQFLDSCFVKMGAQMSTEEKGQCILREVTVKGCKQFVEVDIVGNSGRKAKEDIWKLVSSAFCEPEAICILGTLGVGKTAIAAAIHNRALKKPVLFDSVIWVSLKYGGDLWQVQEDIARSLNLDFPRTWDVVKRAWKLHDALLRTRKFLLVLDSMWQTFSLKDIGIPELVDGRKLIITSRIRSVCTRNRRVFELKPLPENEAWVLFKYEIGSSLSHLHEETLKKTKSAVAELDGLPLAISNLAQTLGVIQEEDPAEINREWMRQLADLATKPIYWQRKDRDLFNRFKCSSDNLKVATRSCLMYCALFPKHHDIESKELMEHWMWEGLLGENMKTLDEGMEKARETLEELKNAHLLQSVTGESVSNDERVKLLSPIRSMSIDSMVDEDRCCFFIRSGCSLTALPWKQEWPPKVEIASFLQNNQLTALKLRGKSSCWRLSTLLLQNNSLTESILDQNILTGMLNLRVLNLSRTSISILPNSLSSLRNLHALLLRNCSKLKILPNLSRLEQLIVLDLSGTALEHFPKGIQNMKKLRRLDFSDTRLETFPPDIVRHLTNLEELLLITAYDCIWGTNPDGQHIKVACVEDLVKMPKLSVLQLHFQNTDAFDKYVSMAALYTNVPSKFRFRVGEVQIGGHVEENSLIISGSPANKTSELAFSVVSLQRLRNLHVLDVSNFNGISYLFDIKILTSLTMLRVLRVRSCNEMVNVLQPGAEDTVSHPVLTKMVFFDLPKLTSICCGKLLNCPNLSSIDVWRCQNLKLPLIESKTSKPHLKIRITGEKSWIKKLKSDNPGSNTNFKLDDAPVPVFLLADTTGARAKREEGGNNDTINTYKNTMLVFGALKYVAEENVDEE